MYRRTRIRISRRYDLAARSLRRCRDAPSVAASRYVYVELRDDRGSLVRRIKLLSRDSVYSGYLPTQSLERFGDYSLTAYTLYMRNQGPGVLLQEASTIWPYRERPQDAAQHLGAQSLGLRRLVLPRRRLPDRRLRLLRGLQGAGGDDGGSVEVTGVLKNDREEVVDTLRTLHGGMGCLRFTAHTGERYYAECTMAGGKTERFDLPASRNTACVLECPANGGEFHGAAHLRTAAAQRAETAGALPRKHLLP